MNAIFMTELMLLITLFVVFGVFAKINGLRLNRKSCLSIGCISAVSLIVLVCSAADETQDETNNRQCKKDFAHLTATNIVTSVRTIDASSDDGPDLARIGTNFLNNGTKAYFSLSGLTNDAQVTKSEDDRYFYYRISFTNIHKSAVFTIDKQSGEGELKESDGN